MKTGWLGVCVAALFGAACLPSGGGGGGGGGVVLIDDDAGAPGEDAGGGGAEDAGEGADVGAVEDVGGTEDTGDRPPGCVGEGFEADRAEVELGTNQLTYIGEADRAGGGYDLLFFTVFGQPSGPPEPGRYVFEDVSFAECETCLVVQTGCSADGCEESYMARGGAVEVLEVSPRFGARVEGLRLERVRIADGETTTLGGDPYCMIAPVEFGGEVSQDPCAGWVDPNFVDTNCGEAPLTVTWDVSGAASSLDQFDFVEWDFGDGNTASSSSSTTASHQYGAGEWDAEVKVYGRAAGADVTITTPEKIRVY